MVEATADIAILYADESRIQLLPLLRAMWCWVGQQLRVPTPGTDDTRMLYGVLNIRTARLVQTSLTEHTRLKLICLPTHCSHLNPVQEIWLHLKNRMAANRLHASMKPLLDTVDAFFNEMTPGKSASLR